MLLRSRALSLTGVREAADLLTQCFERIRSIRDCKRGRRTCHDSGTPTLSLGIDAILTAVAVCYNRSRSRSKLLHVCAVSAVMHCNNVLKIYIIRGVAKRLRHRILIPACEGSNPSSPAKFPKFLILIWQPGLMLAENGNWRMLGLDIPKCSYRYVVILLIRD